MSLQRSGAFARRLLQQQLQRPGSECAAACSATTPLLREYRWQQDFARAVPALWQSSPADGGAGLWRGLHTASGSLQQSAQPAVADDTSRETEQSAGFTDEPSTAQLKAWQEKVKLSYPTQCTPQAVQAHAGSVSPRKMSCLSQRHAHVISVSYSHKHLH